MVKSLSSIPGKSQHGWVDAPQDLVLGKTFKKKLPDGRIVTATIIATYQGEDGESVLVVQHSV